MVLFTAPMAIPGIPQTMSPHLIPIQPLSPGMAPSLSQEDPTLSTVMTVYHGLVQGMLIL